MINNCLSGRTCGTITNVWCIRLLRDYPECEWCAGGISGMLTCVIFENVVLAGAFSNWFWGKNTLSDVKYARHILIYHTEAIENNSEWYYHNYLELRYASPEFLMISENCRLMEIWRTLLSSYVNNFQRLEILLLRDNYYSTSWLSSQNEIVCTCSFVVYNKKCVFSLISTIL